MEHILDGFHVSDLTTQTTGFLVALAPVAELLLGILIGFLVISSIVGLIRGNKRTYYADDDLDDEDYDDI